MRCLTPLFYSLIIVVGLFVVSNRIVAAESLYDHFYKKCITGGEEEFLEWEDEDGSLDLPQKFVCNDIIKNPSGYSNLELAYIYYIRGQFRFGRERDIEQKLTSFPDKVYQCNQSCAEHLQKIRADFTQAVKRAGFYMAYYYRGIIDAQTEDNASALKNLNQAAAAKNKKNLADVLSARAKVHLRLNNFSRAISDYSRYFTLTSDEYKTKPGYQNRALAYEHLRQYKKAISDYDHLINRWPSSYPNFYYYRGRLFEKSGQLQKAINDFHQTLKLEPEHQASQIALARLGEALTPQSKAGLEWEHHCEQGNVQAIIACSRLIYKAQSFEFSLPRQKLSSIYAHRGYAYRYSRKDFARALADFTRAIELQPKKGEIYFKRGVTYMMSKHYSLAREDFHNAVKYGPRKRFVHFYSALAQAYAGEGKKEQARKIYRKIIKLDKRNADHYRNKIRDLTRK